MKKPTEKVPSNQGDGKLVYALELFEDNPHLVEIVLLTSALGFPQCLDPDTADFEAVNQDAKMRKKRHPFYETLAQTIGLASAGMFGKKLQITRRIDSPEWETLMPKILKAIKTHIAEGRKLVNQKDLQASTPPPAPKNGFKPLPLRLRGFY